ncbi:MAG: SDR family NAD(P)-dependent oxidoreductase, partial [Lachnospirales bacterium]
MNFQGKNVLITGTNRGIGKVALEEFAKNGANIIAHTRFKTDSFLAYLDEIEKNYNVKTYPVYCDLSSSEEIKACFKSIHELKISVDVLVNNAGVPHGGFFQMTKIEDIKNIFNVNLFAVMELTQYILKLMVRQKSGAIINISSVSGVNLTEGNCAYGISKSALDDFTKVLSKEVAQYGIRV